jgi:hypothetical protein
VSSLFKKSDKEVSIIFDIGNGSIGASLVEFSSKNVPITLYTHREPLTFLPQVTSKRLVETMLTLLKDVAGHLQKEGLTHIHHSFLGNYNIKDVFCIFSSPWYISQTKVLRLNKEVPFLVSKSFVDELVQAEEEQFHTALREGKYEQIFGHDTRLLEKKIIHTKLNGYEIQNPIGKKANDLEITFFSSFISADLIKKVEATLHGIISFRNIQFFSFALASWSATRDMFTDINNFLFLDISGEMTDISLTYKGVLVETISFPSGRNTLLRRVSEALKVPPEVALSYLLMHSHGNAEEKFAAKIEAVLTETKHEWLTALTQTLQTVSKDYTVPKKVFVTVDADLAHFFIDALKQEMPIEFAIPQNMFDVMFLNSEKVSLFTHVAPKVSSDSFLALESIFLQKIVSLS